MTGPALVHLFPKPMLARQRKGRNSSIFLGVYYRSYMLYEYSN